VQRTSATLFTALIFLASLPAPRSSAEQPASPAGTPLHQFEGRPFRFHLGFECTDTPDGVAVAAVEPFDSSRFRPQSLRPGDRIVSIGGTPLRKAADLQEQVLPALTPFRPVDIEVLRGRLTIKLPLVPIGFTALELEKEGGGDQSPQLPFELPQAIQRELPPSVAAARAEGTINVLTRVILDPATGDIEFLGRYDPRFPTGGIPYQDLLKTALAHPQPWLSLDPQHISVAYAALWPTVPLLRATLSPSQTTSASYSIAAVFGHPGYAGERQQFIRTAAAQYGLTTAEYVGVHNFLHVESDGTVWPDDIVDLVAKAIRHAGYGDTAEAWVSYARGATPAAYRGVLSRCGRQEGDSPGSLRVQALFALLGSYRQITKAAWQKVPATTTRWDLLLPPLPESWKSMVRAVEQDEIPEAALVAALERSILPRITEDTETDLFASSIGSIIFFGTGGRRQHISTNVPRDSQLSRIMFEADFCFKTLTSWGELFAKAHPLSQVRPTVTGYRMWWEPKQAPLEVSADRRVVTFGPVEMAAKCEPGGHKPVGPDTATMQFVPYRNLQHSDARALLEEYFSLVGRDLDDFAETRPSFHELREAAKVIAVAQWMIRNKVRINVDTLEQTRWIPPAFVTTPTRTKIHFSIQRTELAPELLGGASGGVTFDTGPGWAPMTTDQRTEAELPQALVESNALGQAAATAAIEGRLEQARELAELSAQAMLGPLTENQLAGIGPLPRPSGGVRWSASPATARAQAELARAIMHQVDGVRTGAVSRESAVASLEPIRKAYRAIAESPTGEETRRVVTNLEPTAGRRAGRGPRGVSIRLVAVPSVGRALLGSPPREAGRKKSEEPAFIQLSTPFMISMTEITQKQFRDVMGTSPWTGKRGVRTGDDFPATWVTWPEAVAFCGKLTDQLHGTGELPESEQFRLPTEAEWETACRGGAYFAYCYGDDASLLGRYAWFQKNAQQGGEPFAHRVGTKLPNNWGLYDMHGNVLEWCQDWYAGSYGEGDVMKGPATGSRRVCRGGSWGHAAADCRSASRFALPPSECNEFVGFRVVRARRE